MDETFGLFVVVSNTGGVVGRSVFNSPSIVVMSLPSDGVVVEEASVVVVEHSLLQVVFLRQTLSMRSMPLGHSKDHFEQVPFTKTLPSGQIHVTCMHNSCVISYSYPGSHDGAFKHPFTLS